MTHPLRLAVIGYGSGGQAAALALARDGHAVEVFERVPQPGPVGAGFLLQPTGLQALWRLGLLAQVWRQGARIHYLQGETTTGRWVMDMQYAMLDQRLSGLGMQRGALFALLDAAIKNDPSIQLHAGCEVTALDCDGGRLQDAEGRWHGPYDLLVVADGAASRLRGDVTAMRIDQPYPWGALWCLLPEGDWPWKDGLRQRYQHARQMAGLLPVGQMPNSSERMLSFFWSLPVAGFDAWQKGGDQAFLQALQSLWPEAHAQFGAAFETGKLARAVYRDAIPQRWWHRRAVLLGDAAHAMSPQLGQGANMALVDALALAAQLRTGADTASALAAYQRERQAHLAMYHRYSRWLTPLFQSHRDQIAHLRDLTFLRSGRLPLARAHMLRVLTGVQHGWWGRYPLEPEFLEALDGLAAGNLTAQCNGQH